MYLRCRRCTSGVEDVPLVEFMYIVFTRMSGESPTYCRRLRSLLLCLCSVFRALIINSLVWWRWWSLLSVVHQVLAEAPELFCKPDSLGPVLCPCFLVQGQDCSVQFSLTSSLPQPVKFPGWKVHTQACKQYIFRSQYNKSTFDTTHFDGYLFTC